KNPDTLRLGVTPTSKAPPAAVADLLASANPVVAGQISLTWTAPQGNAGGVPIANVTVSSYAVHIATFSVDSLLGDTTAWWNSTTAGSATLQPPGYTPQAPGSAEAYTFTGLTPGATYYFGLRSTSPYGVTSPVDTKTATPTQQASAISSIFAPPPPS